MLYRSRSPRRLPQCCEPFRPLPPWDWTARGAAQFGRAAPHPTPGSELPARGAAAAPGRPAPHRPAPTAPRLCAAAPATDAAPLSRRHPPPALCFRCRPDVMSSPRAGSVWRPRAAPCSPRGAARRGSSSGGGAAQGRVSRGRCPLSPWTKWRSGDGCDPLPHLAVPGGTVAVRYVSGLGLFVPPSRWPGCGAGCLFSVFLSCAFPRVGTGPILLNIFMT